MAAYTCPVCEEHVPRDLMIFLDHTNKHIFEAIKRKHPEWATPDGVCRKCEEYYEKEIKGGL